MGHPHPQLGDTELQRARNVARAYRSHLRTANRVLCDALDDAVADAGEAWWLVEETITVDPDELVTTTTAAQLAHVQPGTIRQWRKRGYLDRHGRRTWLHPRRVDHRGWPLFLAADVLEAAAATRRTRQRKTR